MKFSGKEKPNRKFRVTCFDQFAILLADQSFSTKKKAMIYIEMAKRNPKVRAILLNNKKVY